MNYARELTNRYWAFYRAERKPKIGFTGDGCTRPIDLACKILISQTTLSDEELIDTIAARLSGLMKQIHAETASVGRWVTAGKPEQEAICEFSRFFIKDFFRHALNGDRARLVGNKYRLLVNTCEFLYRLKEDELRAEKAPEQKS